jgi:hypothetical protein
MNQLKRDIKLLQIGNLVALCSFLSLGLLALARKVFLRLSEQEFYRQYPIGWWVVVILGLCFMVSAVYCIKKKLDIHPNIQLRSKPDEYLESILADPEYQFWHEEAQRLLEIRHNAS